MEPYVDIVYYINEFKGSIIPNNSFHKKAVEASRKVKYFARDLVKTSDDVKYTTCLVAELLYNQEILKSKINFNKEIASETLGPRSVTYTNNSQMQFNQILSDKELQKQIYQICIENIPQYMYRGT